MELQGNDEEKNETLLRKFFKKEAKKVLTLEVKPFRSMVDATRLTGWIKPGEIWQLNIWTWILQPNQN